MFSGRRQSIKSNPRKNANILSILTFWWTLKVFRTGASRDLDESDLFEPLADHSCAALGSQAAESWHREHQLAARAKRSPHVFRMLCRHFFRELCWHHNILMLLELFVRLMTPIFLGFLLKYFNAVDRGAVAENVTTQPTQSLISQVFSTNQTSLRIERNEAICFSAAMIFFIMLTSFIVHPYMIMTMHTGMKMRIACSSLLYRKALRLSHEVFSKLAAGNVINLMSNDISRLDYFPVFLPYLWICPIQIVLITFLMYRIVGQSALVGISIVFIFFPIQIYFGCKMASLRNRIGNATDNRVNLMNELLQSIQVIKMYAWERPLSEQIRAIRRTEVGVLKRLSLIRGCFMSSIMFVSRLGIYLTFVNCVYWEGAGSHPITAENLFVITAYYMILRQTMTVFFPQGVAMVAETIASVQRINDFLLKEESDVGNRTILYPECGNGTGVRSELKSRPSSFFTTGLPIGVTLENVSVCMPNRGYALDDVSLDFKPDALTIIVGPVGSGKSLILDVILGELRPSDGFVRVHGSLSYSTQEPWMFAGQVRQNILFGEKLDRQKYNLVLRNCALVQDMRSLPFADRTRVGDRGVSLSGGQRARISLARAIYKDADIYILDDPLSAVDPKVANQLFNDCVCGQLKGKCCVLVTHQVQFLSSADHVVVMERGKVAAQGTYTELCSQGIDFFRIVMDQNKISEPVKKSLIQAQAAAAAAAASAAASMGLRRRSIDSFCGDNEDDPRVDNEFCKKGSVNPKIYLDYLKSGASIFVIILMIFLFILSQLLASSTDFWVNYWAFYEEHVGRLKQSNQRTFYIQIYSLLIVSLSLISLLRSFLFFTMCTKSSIQLHKLMFGSVIRAPMLFFNTNPSGRILNRFSKDIGSVDEYLPNALMDCFQIVLNLIGAMIVVFLLNVYLLLPTCALLALIVFLRNQYLKTSRSVKRLEAITRSPIYSHLNASLQGLNTIRVNEVESILIDEFNKYQDLHSSAWYLFITTSRAFGLWLDLLCAIYIAFVIASFLFLTQNSYTGNVGLSVTQCIGLTGILQWGIRQSAELENQMTSVERVLEFIDIEPEKHLDEMPVTEVTKIPDNWPSHGRIRFEKMSLFYSPTNRTVPSLNNIDLRIEAGEKIGIVGRTGAGKSSIISALFRLSCIEGRISIDDIDTDTISLHDLRKRLSIIPQEPILFLGTMRYNLDPFDEFANDKLEHALTIVELNIPLDYEVLHSGSNLSVGQRQLVCLARAIVRNNKVLVLDEATANVDPQTDSLIQTTIRDVFRDCTVLTIAHRLQTVMDCDKILVMDGGRVAEFDHPFRLIGANGLFSQLVEQSGPENEYRFRQTAQDVLVLRFETVQ